MGIPTLPKKEIPEVGYRLIRDALLDYHGDDLNSEETASDQIIRLLKDHPNSSSRAEKQ